MATMLDLDKGAIHENILSLISNEKRGLLLDTGAGTGALSLRLQEMGFSVIAIDISRNYRAKLLRKEMEFILGDLDGNLPFKSGVFDYVVAVEVIEHLENPWHFLREVGRVLKIGGKLYLTTPNVHSLHQRLLLLSKPFYFFDQGDFEYNKHLNPLLFWNLRRMLGLGGFEIERITFNRAFIPLLRIRMPKKFLFGENLILICQKVREPRRPMSREV